MDVSSKRFRLAAAGALLLLLLVAALLWREAPSPPPVAHGSTASSEGRAGNVKNSAQSQSPSQSEAVKPNPSAPIIDEVIVEKTEVCEGEENLVTVKAHTPDATDPYLHAAIGVGKGMSVPVKSFILTDGSHLRPLISVFGKNAVATRREVPDFIVKNCKPERTVSLGTRPISNRIDEFELSARVRSSDASEKAVLYLWNFGDGRAETTESPFVLHSYKGRPQHSMYSDFLAKVEVTFDSGHTAIGRTSIELANSGFIELDRLNVVVLFSEATPRFPELDSAGKVSQTFAVWHAYDHPVRIEKVSLVRQSPDGRRGEPTRASGILHDAEVPVGKAIDVTLSFDTKKEPDAFALVYQLEGTTADGKRALGELVLMKPPPNPTRENSTPIDDPTLVAKIRKAIRILGKSTVSEEEMMALEREGRLTP